MGTSWEAIIHPITVHSLAPEDSYPSHMKVHSPHPKVSKASTHSVSSPKSYLSETEQDPMVLAPHVLRLPFVCGKTLAKE